MILALTFTVPDVHNREGVLRMTCLCLWTSYMPINSVEHTPRIQTCCWYVDILAAIIKVSIKTILRYWLFGCPKLRRVLCIWSHIQGDQCEHPIPVSFPPDVQPSAHPRLVCHVWPPLWFKKHYFHLDIITWQLRGARSSRSLAGCFIWTYNTGKQLVTATESTSRLQGVGKISATKEHNATSLLCLSRVSIHPLFS